MVKIQRDFEGGMNEWMNEWDGDRNKLSSTTEVAIGFVGVVKVSCNCESEVGNCTHVSVSIR